MGEYKFLQPYGEQLIKKTDSIIVPGLWYGKMGIALTLFHLFQITKVREYELKANNLIDEVYTGISHQMPFYFADGLLGIGCGIEYIINKGFVNGNSDEILSEIDTIAKNIIDNRYCNSLDFERGVCGVGYYLYCRLRSKSINDESITTLKLKEYLIYLIDWIEDILLKTKEKTIHNDTYFLLSCFYKLGIINYKVEKITTFCLKKVLEGKCKIQDNYELLGIPTLKILKPWI